MTTTASVPPAENDVETTFPSVVVEDMLRLLDKAVRAHQLYLPNNPMYVRSIELLATSFAAIWKETEEIALSVTDTELRWEGVAVMSVPAKASDSLPWLFYKDGIRELRVLRGFEQGEIVGLLDILQRVRHASPDEDDLLTMLWEKDFVHLRYRYVDLTSDQVASVDTVASPHRVDHVPPPADMETMDSPRAGVVNLDDFDATLYFLDEREIEYLRSEVRKEYDRDLRSDVLAMLLDICELQTDEKVRGEICAVLDSLILHLLSAQQFRSVAFLLREVATTTQRAPALLPAHRAALSQLPERLSAQSALGQLLQALDLAEELPPQEDLNELFEQLRPAALETVFLWLGRFQNPRLRLLLENAASRLAASNTSELVRLIAATDKSVAIEAIRRAGALKTAAAVAPLAKVLSEPDAALRLAAVLALAEIGSAGAMQLLERAVDDVDRDVRVATARALTARSHRPSLPRIEAAIRGKALRDADLTEKIAFFEAFGTLCGDAGVGLLDSILNAKSFLGRRDDTELRACAATALGRIGTAMATDSLRRGSVEKDIVVRNAVSKALRGGAL